VEAVRARPALAAVARLEALEDECAQLEHEVKAALTPLQPTRLLAMVADPQALQATPTPTA
jgi:hypothetical protein